MFFDFIFFYYFLICILFFFITFFFGLRNFGFSLAEYMDEEFFVSLALFLIFSFLFKSLIGFINMQVQNKLSIYEEAFKKDINYLNSVILFNMNLNLYFLKELDFLEKFVDEKFKKNIFNISMVEDKYFDFFISLEFNFLKDKLNRALLIEKTFLYCLTNLFFDGFFISNFLSFSDINLRSKSFNYLSKLIDKGYYFINDFNYTPLVFNFVLFKNNFKYNFLRSNIVKIKKKKKINISKRKFKFKILLDFNVNKLKLFSFNENFRLINSNLSNDFNFFVYFFFSFLLNKIDLKKNNFLLYNSFSYFFSLFNFCKFSFCSFIKKRFFYFSFFNYLFFFNFLYFSNYVFNCFFSLNYFLTFTANKFNFYFLDFFFFFQGLSDIANIKLVFLLLFCFFTKGFYLFDFFSVFYFFFYNFLFLLNSCSSSFFNLSFLFLNNNCFNYLSFFFKLLILKLNSCFLMIYPSNKLSSFIKFKNNFFRDELVFKNLSNFFFLFF